MIAISFLFLAFISSQAGSQTANSISALPTSPFTGKGVEGGGTVCNAGLRIHPRYIDFDTTYSSCLHTRYDTLTTKPNEYVYRLKPTSKECKFRILIVRPVFEMGGWELIGFDTEAAWRHNGSNPADKLECGTLY